VQAGFNPNRPLHAYRRATLCLIVRSIGEAAGLEINNKGTGFVGHRAVRAAPLRASIAPGPSAETRPVIYRPSRARCAMTKRNGGDDRAHFDAKIQRATGRLIDEVLNVVALGMRQGILLRVMSRADLEHRLIEVARSSALSDIDGAKLADNIIDDVIRTLRRAFPDRSTPDLELLLADARADAVSKLGQSTEGLIDYCSFINDVVDALVTKAADQASP
jgi:hypothetical protein